ncbi:MAG: hypothetical protein V4574_00350 [Pseudomonadota bacterium]
MLSRSILVPALAALLLPAAAQAQAAQSTGDFAVELAYAYCPKLIDGDLAIEGPELKALGFTDAPMKKTHPRVGALTMLGTRRADAEVSISVNDGSSFCQVNVIGDASGAAYPKLRAGLPRLGHTFEADPANSGVRGPATVETLKARLDKDLVLNVQFVRGNLSTAPIAGFQMIMMDQ